MASGYPVEEQDSVQVIADNLQNMWKHCDEFDAAVSLFDFSQAESVALAEQDQAINFDPDVKPGSQEWDHWCEAQEQRRKVSSRVSEWGWIAGRDGAMTIWHVGELIEASRQLLHFCPTFREKLDITKLRSAASELRTRFPSYKAMRNAIGHRAELTATPHGKELNSTKKPTKNQWLDDKGQNTIINVIAGRTMCITFKGQLVEYEISWESAESLRFVRNRFYAGFKDVHQHTGHPDGYHFPYT